MIPAYILSESRGTQLDNSIRLHGAGIYFPDADHLGM